MAHKPIANGIFCRDGSYDSSLSTVTLLTFTWTHSSGKHWAIFPLSADHLTDSASSSWKQVHRAGAQVLMINTDGLAWGGSMSDLDAVLVSKET